MRVFLLQFLLIFTFGLAFAQPTTITYQGKLLNNSNLPINQNSITISFAIYDALTGGNKIWPPNNTAAVKTVNVISGLYSVTLGTGVGSDEVFSASIFNGVTPYLEVTVSSSTLPRTALTNVPFSLVANQLAASGWASPGSIGSTTPNAGKFAGLTVGSTTNTYTFPATRGMDGQIMQTNGSGILSWINPATPNWASPGSIGSTTPNAGAFTGLKVGTGTTTYTFPNARGTNNQIIQTDSNGNLSWVTPAATDWASPGSIGSTAPNAGAFTGLKVGTGTTTYTFPNARGTNNQIIQTNGSGNLTWVNPYIGLTNFMESNYNYDSKTGVKLLSINDATDVDIVLQPKGAGGILAQQPDGTSTGGNNRGINAVDLQTYRTDATHIASGNYSVIGGGLSNKSKGISAVVSGGELNKAVTDYSTVGGGYSNEAKSQYSTISGGRNNSAFDNYTTIGGGRSNLASANFATISGGKQNNAEGIFSFIGGGEFNTATGPYSFVGGGLYNSASNNASLVSGGIGNSASELGSTIAGGYQNYASAEYTTVSGGTSNVASGYISTISGGFSNTASSNYSIIAGGSNNEANNEGSSILGGVDNTASGQYSTVVGGTGNSSVGDYTLSGGIGNTAQSYGETVVGLFATVGDGETTSLFGYDRLFVLGNGTSSDSRSNAITILKNSHTTIGGNGNDGVLSLYSEQGDLDYYVEFQPNFAMTECVTLTFPENDGDENQFLRTDGFGNLSWVNPPTTDWANPEFIGSETPNAGAFTGLTIGTGTATYTFPSAAGTNGQIIKTDGNGILSWEDSFFDESQLTYDTTQVSILTPTGDSARIDFVVNPKGLGSILANIPDGTSVGGNGRGERAVDLQRTRNQATMVASGRQSTIAGGVRNTASGERSAIGGGYQNTASGDYSSIPGGSQGAATGTNTSVIGGFQNTANGDYAAVAGGSDNVADGNYSLAGGRNNTAKSYGEVVLGLNATNASGNSSSYVATNRLFSIGNGSTSGSRSNAITILKNAQTTIGDNGNDGVLRLYSEQGATDYILQLQPNAAMTQNVTFSFPTDDGNASQLLQTDGNGNLTWVDPSSSSTDWANPGSIGSTTPNAGKFTGLTVGTGTTTYTFPNSRGTNGQIIQTNGSGGLTWVTPTSADWASPGSIGSTTPNGGKFTGLTVGTGTTTYTFPNARGNNGQILQTNGSGVLSWVNPSSTDWASPGSIGSTTPNAGAFTGLTIGTGTTTYTFPNSRGTNGQIIQTNGSGGLSWVYPTTTDWASPGSIGSTTPNAGAFTGLTIGTGTTTYTFPNSRGTNGQIIQTNGSGGLSWVNPSTADWASPGSIGSTTPNAGAFTTLKLGTGTTTYTFPSARGANGQTIQTNGSGGLSWVTPSTGGAAIIPFSSGSPITLTTQIIGTPGLPSFVGFGNSSQGLTILGSTIDLTGGSGQNINFAFSMPSSGTITSISAYFSNTIALALIGTTLTINAQLYESTTPNNIFTPVAGTLVSLSPAYTGLVTIGTSSSGIITGLSIPCTANTRYLMIFSASASGLGLLNTISGYASAGMRIE